MVLLVESELLLVISVLRPPSWPQGAGGNGRMGELDTGIVRDSAGDPGTECFFNCRLN